MQKNEFIEKTASLIKYKKVRQEVKDELSAHIEDLKKEYIENEKADVEKNDVEIEEKIIQQMGDINDIAKEFNKIYKPKHDWIFNIVCSLLFIVGIVINVFLVKQNILPSVPAQSITILSTITIISFLCYKFADYKLLEDFSMPLFVMTIVLTILSYKISILSKFNPIILILHIVSYVGLIRRFPSKLSFVFLTFVSLASAAFLGNTNLIILCVIYLIILIFRKKNKLNRAVLISSISVVCIVLCTLALFSADITQKRIDAFSSPESYSDEDGYIYIAKKQLLNESKLVGKSSLNIADYIGNISDYNLFTYIITEFGFLFSFFVIALFGVFVYKLIANSFKINDEYGKLIFVGISCLLSLQILFNILNGLNVVPYLTVHLPFFSIDTFNLSYNIITIFLLLSIYRRKNLTIK